MNELEQLAKKYGSDKFGKHTYCPVYYEMFKDRKESIKEVLEIGVGEGASLRMWKEFFPNAFMYGIDNQDNRIFEEIGMIVYKADQGNRDQLLEVWDEINPGYPDLDLVIDDGSHLLEHQIFTCLTLMPLTRRKTDFTYVIEDIDVSNAEFIERILKLNYDVKVVECGKRYDDRLIIVKHKNG